MCGCQNSQSKVALSFYRRVVECAGAMGVTQAMRGQAVLEHSGGFKGSLILN